MALEEACGPYHLLKGKCDGSDLTQLGYIHVPVSHWVQAQKDVLKPASASTRGDITARGRPAESADSVDALSVRSHRTYETQSYKFEAAEPENYTSTVWQV